MFACLSQNLGCKIKKWRQKMISAKAAVKFQPRGVRTWQFLSPPGVWLQCRTLISAAENLEAAAPCKENKSAELKKKDRYTLAVVFTCLSLFLLCLFIRVCFPLSKLGPSNQKVKFENDLCIGAAPWQSIVYSAAASGLRISFSPGLFDFSAVHWCLLLRS